MRTIRNLLGLAAGMTLLSLLTIVLALGAQPISTIVAQEGVEPVETHVNAEDYVWDSADMTAISLSGDVITVTGDGATVDGGTVTITAAGNYSLSGTLADGQVVVNTDDEQIVRLILNGVNISSSSTAPINIVNAEETLIVLTDNTDNIITDASVYVFPSPDEDEPSAAIFSNDALTIYGSGTLTVNGNYNDAISSDDGLVITSGSITVNAVDDGIRGKDYLVVESGTLNINAGGDGLKSTNEDAGTGYITIAAGIVNAITGGDGIAAQSNVLISDGTFTLTSGGGSTAYVSDDLSTKGIKAGVNLQIDGGTFIIDAADDALHANATIIVNAGNFTLATGDDGVHADTSLTINGGDITITDSYEGIESAVITLNDGDVSIVASDDGVNVAGGTDGSGMMARPGRGGGMDQFTAASTEYYLYINGGYVVVDAGGDGLDANGAIEMAGGVVVVNGPTEMMNGALDYDAWFIMTGGWLVTAGSAGMAQAPSESSTQASLLLNFSAAQAAGTLVHLQNSAGEAILTFAPTKSFQSITFSSPQLTQGASYDVYLGGAYSGGTATDGVYTGGTYSGGTLYTNFTVSGITTMIGNASMGRGGRP